MIQDRPEDYRGSLFEEVWNLVKSDPYALPDSGVTLAQIFGLFQYRLLDAGRRTVSDPRDILPRFQKLIRPNGVCLAGQWKITEKNPYSGYFQYGRSAPVVARASVAMRDTRQGKYRSFGLAGKLFPGGSRVGGERVRTANFFVIDDNGGTLEPHYMAAEMVTEPSLSRNPSSLAHLPILIAITIAQHLADSHPERRQLYPIAEAGVVQSGPVRAPRYMMIKGAAGSPRLDAPDFREELRVARTGAELVFDILVRDDKSGPWQPIGVLQFDDSVVSDSCDHRLHFHHARWRKDAV
ncbi:MAG TPA: hypothetical protein VGI39_39925 [Polyangiaceae bacterium]